MGGFDRSTPRTCTPENANAVTSGDNPTTYVADMAINPETGIAEPINVKPILTQVDDLEKVRENMKQLLDIIIGFFEVETQKVESGALKEEDMIFGPYDLSTDDTSSKRPVRPLPAQFNRRRAYDSPGHHQTDLWLDGFTYW